MAKRKKTKRKDITFRAKDSLPDGGERLFYPLPLPPTASTFARRVWSFFGIVAILLTFILPCYLLSNQSFFFESLQRIPRILLIIIISVLTIALIMRIVVTYQTIRTKSKFRSNPHYAWSLRRYNILLDSVGAALFGVIIMYGFGVIDTFAHYLSSVFPNFGDQVNYAISTVFGWIISGIIGNAAYDSIKKFGEKMSNPKKQNEKLK